MREAPTERRDRPGPQALETALETTLDVRPVRLRDAWGVGLSAARELEAEARGRRRPGGGRRRRLHEIRATYPPPPFRLYSLIMVNVLTIAAMPSFMVRTPNDWAVVTTWPLSGPHRHRHHLREAAVVGPFATVVAGLILAVYRLRPELLVVVGLVVGPLVWFVVKAVIEAPSTRGLNRRQRALVKASSQPVHFAAGLASGGSGAGTRLVGELTKRADEMGVTLLGRAEEGPLVGLYERAGFHVAASASMRWGRLVLVLREARPVRAA